MRSTRRLAAEADRLRARVEALERLAAESRREEQARTRHLAEAQGEPTLVELEALTAVARVAAEAKAPTAVMTSVEQALARALGTRVVRVLLADEDGGLTVAHAAPGGVVDEAPAQTTPLARRVLERQAPLRTSAYAETCRREGVAPPASTPTAPHALWAPLLASGQVIGVIEVWRRTQPFSGADERLVTTLGGLLALALRAINPSAR